MQHRRSTAKARLAVPLVLVLALALPFVVIEGCSSSSGGGSSPGGDTGAGNDASNERDTNPSSGDAAGGGDTSSPDTGSGQDGSGGSDAGSCDIPQGGLPCDPNSIYCNAPCNTTTSYCCIENDAEACIPSAQNCSGDSLHCDEATDCPAGNICCFVAGSLSAGDTVCATQCSGGIFNIQVCRTNSECVGGGGCVLQNCNNVPVEACGHIPGCN